MKSTLSRMALTSSMILTLFAVSCGKKDSVDSVCDAMVTQMDAFVTAIESAKDKDSAEKAATKLGEIADEMVALSGRLDALGDPSEEDKKIVKEKMDKAEAANKPRMEAAFGNLSKYPEAGVVLKKALESFSEKMKSVEAINKKYGIK